MVTDPLIGKKLGDYKIVGLLGRGGMSRVYRGYDDNLDRYAAVKVISGDFATTSEDEYTRRFQSEARAIARLRHPSIVGVYQFGRSHGIYYMAMVWLDGKDLRTVLRDYARAHERMPAEEVLRITQDVAGALDYAHQQGVIHRDIKPSNIMLERVTGRAVLMDFGLALSVQEGTQGDTFGSAHYIAPEQAVSSAQAVPQSDLYSLGVVLYEMLTGRVPFDEPSAMSVALHHLNDPPPPPREINPDLSLDVERVLLRLLSKEPGERYASGQALVDALAEVLDPSTPRAPTDSRPGAGNGLLEMLDRPVVHEESPSFSSRPSDPEVLPTPMLAPSGRSKLAEKFAQRKASREEEAALDEVDADALQIDSDTLSSLLDSYADPRDLGLVGPDATGLPRRALTDDSAAARKRSRRSRVGLLLTLILLVAIAGGAAYFGLGLGRSDDDTTPDAPAVVAENDKTETPDRVTPDDPTVPAEAAVSDATQTDVPTPTAPPSATPTRFPDAEAVPVLQSPSPDRQPSPTLERQAAMTATSQLEAVPPTAGSPETTPVPPSSDTPEPSETVPATEALRPSDTPDRRSDPTATSGEPADSGPDAPLDAGKQLKLIYNDNSLVMVNTSDQTLDVSGLVFERERADGTRLAFDARTWSTYTPYNASQMFGESCYQILVADATQVTPPEAVCGRFLGWYRATIPRRYFWVEDEPSGVFTVRDADGVVLATCALDGSPCTFDLNAE